MALSLMSRIQAIEQANVLKDIIVMPTFRFHRLRGNLNDYFAVDVKTSRDKWRILLQPLDANEDVFRPCNIDTIAGSVKIVEIREAVHIMSNYTEYNDKVAFHPGYYIEEILGESGLTPDRFANRLGITPDRLRVLIQGNESLSVDIATNLAKMLDTTVAYWLNLQKAYDEKMAEFLSEKASTGREADIAPGRLQKEDSIVLRRPVTA